MTAAAVSNTILNYPQQLRERVSAPDGINLSAAFLSQETLYRKAQQYESGGVRERRAASGKIWPDLDQHHDVRESDCLTYFRKVGSNNFASG